MIVIENNDIQVELTNNLGTYNRTQVTILKEGNRLHQFMLQLPWTNSIKIYERAALWILMEFENWWAQKLNSQFPPKNIIIREDFSIEALFEEGIFRVVETHPDPEDLLDLPEGDDILHVIEFAPGERVLTRNGTWIGVPGNPAALRKNIATHLKKLSKPEVYTIRPEPHSGMHRLLLLGQKIHFLSGDCVFFQEGSIIAQKENQNYIYSTDLEGFRRALNTIRERA